MSTQSLTDDEPEDVASTSTANSGGTSNDSLTKHFTLEGCVTDLIEADNEQIDLPIATSRTAAISLNDSPYSHVGDVHSTIVHGENINIMITAADTEQTKGIAALERPQACDRPNESATDRRETSTVSLIRRLKKLLKGRPPQFWIAAVLLAILSVVTFVVIFTLPNLVSPTTSAPPTPGRDDNLENGIQIIQRHEWGGRKPINVTKFEKPVKMVRILHTAGANCHDYPTCASSVLGTQIMEMSTQGMPDLAYNYMIGGDGNVYLGRGPDVQNEWQRNAIDIGYIGTFLPQFDEMSDKMDLAGRRLIAKLRREGYLTPDYIVIGQNQTFNTLSPGENIYKKIVKWPHFDNGLHYG